MIPKFQNSSSFALWLAITYLLKYCAMYGLFSTMLTLADDDERTRKHSKVRCPRKKLEFWNKSRKSLIHKAFSDSSVGIWLEQSWNLVPINCAVPKFQRSSKRVGIGLELWNKFHDPVKRYIARLPTLAQGHITGFSPKQKSPTNLAVGWARLIKYYLIAFTKASIAILVLTSSAVTSPLAFAFLHLVLIVSITLLV